MMREPGSEDFLLGEWRVRPAHGEICRGEERIRLEPRLMAVLVALCDRAPEPLSKEELIRSVWNGAAVSDGVITHAIWHLRRVFDDSREDPQVIETIPKRGYKIVAPVVAVAEDSSGSNNLNISMSPGEAGELTRESGGSRRLLLWGAVVAVLLCLLSLAVAMILAAGNRRSIEIDHWKQDFRQKLAWELGVQKPGVPSPSCPSGLVKNDTCVEVSYRENWKSLKIDIVAISTDGSEYDESYHAPTLVGSSPEEIDTVATEAADLVRAFISALGSELYWDRDVLLWRDSGVYDIRAVQKFVSGLESTYRHVKGGWEEMGVATRFDPDFVAPLVYRTPDVVKNGSVEERRRLRARLEELQKKTNPFESAMIAWAIAFIEGDVAKQIHWLKIAVGRERYRPAVLALAAEEMDSENYEDAWSKLDQLVEERWHFPGLYPVAAACAFSMGEIETARFVLHQALEAGLGGAVDPSVYDLLHLLAIYDGDAETSEEYLLQLEKRNDELADEVYDFDRTPFAEILAADALKRGRQEAHDKLREFVD